MQIMRTHIINVFQRGRVVFGFSPRLCSRRNSPVLGGWADAFGTWITHAKHTRTCGPEGGRREYSWGKGRGHGGCCVGIIR